MSVVSGISGGGGCQHMDPVGRCWRGREHHQREDGWVVVSDGNVPMYQLTVTATVVVVMAVLGLRLALLVL